MAPRKKITDTDNHYFKQWRKIPDSRLYLYSDENVIASSVHDVHNVHIRAICVVVGSSAQASRECLKTINSWPNHVL